LSVEMMAPTPNEAVQTVSRTPKEIFPPLEACVISTSVSRISSEALRGTTVAR
jgi:hypothetical protein